MSLYVDISHCAGVYVCVCIGVIGNVAACEKDVARRNAFSIGQCECSDMSNRTDNK